MHDANLQLRSDLQQAVKAARDAEQALRASLKSNAGGGKHGHGQQPGGTTTTTTTP
jgi:hypothetical protein